MREAIRTSNQIPADQHNADRMRRAGSWLNRSEEATSDGEKFIFLWIAFNAAYGRDVTDSQNQVQRQQFNDFLRKIVERDEQRDIERILWDTYSGPIRIILENKYVYGPFWKWIQGDPESARWPEWFRREGIDVHCKIAERDVHGILKSVFSRLYTLRNQIFHGGATFSEGWGQAQVRDGSRIMAAIVPTVLRIMQNDINHNPHSDVWGMVSYPRVNYEPE